MFAYQTVSRVGSSETVWCSANMYLGIFIETWRSYASTIVYTRQNGWLNSDDIIFWFSRLSGCTPSVTMLRLVTEWLRTSAPLSQNEWPGFDPRAVKLYTLRHMRLFCQTLTRTWASVNILLDSIIKTNSMPNHKIEQYVLCNWWFAKADANSTHLA